MSSKIALLAIGEKGLALPVEVIRCILPAPRVYSLPLLVREVAGVFVHEQQVVPLLDPACVLSSGVCGGQGAYVVLCFTELGDLALPVDRVLHIVDLDSGRLDPGAEGEDTAVSYFVYSEVRYPLYDGDAIVASFRN